MRPPFALRLAFVLLVVAEIAVFVLATRWLGGWVVFWLVLATSLLGGWVIRNEGVRAWTALAEAVRAGRAPDRDLTASRAVITGGLLLLLPGFVTDLVGASLALPVTRKRTMALLASLRPASRPHMGPAQRPGSPPGGPVIEGEVVDPEDPER